MSKRFWAGFMLFCLFVTMSSGAYLYMTLKEKSTVEVPLQTITDKKPAHKETKKTPQETVASPKEEAPETNETQQIEAKAEAPKPEVKEKKSEPKLTRNILFTLYSSSAKEVFIIGDFNEWYREPLEKSGKSWTVAKQLKPGRYKYLYVIDGRRIRDPNNKKTSADGRSILTVKPPAGT